MADTLGERITRLRGRTSQTKIAALAGINLSTLNRIERGKNARPERATLEKIARALGVPPVQLTDLIPASATLEATGEHTSQELRLMELEEELKDVRAIAREARRLAERACAQAEKSKSA